MDYEKEIVKRINELSGSRAPYDVFYDWIKCTALSISNSTDIFHNKVWEQREEEYLKIIRSYGNSGKIFAEMTGLLTLALNGNISDILGKVYMESGCGNKNTGQFFTPFQLSIAAASCSLPNDVSPEKTIVLNEPSCGGGGMIIAAAKVLKDRGINPQRVMRVVAQDLDWKSVYMTYMQLSLIGINAIVVQGDTLSESCRVSQYPPERTFKTPMAKGMIL